MPSGQIQELHTTDFASNNLDFLIGVFDVNLELCEILPKFSAYLLEELALRSDQRLLSRHDDK